MRKPQSITRLFKILLWSSAVYAINLQAKAQELASLEAILTDLASYEFGDPTPWRPELLDTMHSVYQNTNTQIAAIQLMSEFLRSNASGEAKRIVQDELRVLEPNPPKTVGLTDLFDEADRLMAQPKDWPDKHEGLLTIAEQMVDLGKHPEALRLYDYLSSNTDNIMIRTAALYGRFHVSQQPINILKTALKSPESKLRRQAIRLARDLPTDFAKGARLFKVVPLSDAEKAQLLNLLAERRDRSIHSKAVEYSKSASPTLRKAALYVFELLGQAGDVLLLAEWASEEIDTESDLARKALYRMPGQAIDKKIVALLGQSPTEVQIELIKAIEERNITTASKPLLDVARSSTNQKVVSESLQAVAMTGTIETLESLIDLLEVEQDSKVQKNIERSISRIVSRFPDDPIGKELLKRLESRSN